MSIEMAFSEEVMYSIEELLARTQDSLEGCQAIIDVAQRSEEMEFEVRPALHTVADSLHCSLERLSNIKDLIDFRENADCFGRI